MIDLREFLREQRKVIDSKNPKKPADGQVVKSRTHLMDQARKTLRYHIQRQLIENLRGFDDPTAPSDRRKLA